MGPIPTVDSWFIIGVTEGHWKKLDAEVTVLLLGSRRSQDDWAVTVFVGSARLRCVLMEAWHIRRPLSVHGSGMRCEAWRGRNQELWKRCSLCSFHRAQVAGQMFGIQERCGKARPEGLICGDSVGPRWPTGRPACFRSHTLNSVLQATILIILFGSLNRYLFTCFYLRIFCI